MARFAVSAKVNPSGSVDPYHVPDAINGSTTASTQVTVAANIATLVADGASPTQGHVNTLNTNYALFVATLGSLPANADVVLSIDATKVTTIGALKAALGALVRSLAGGVLPP